MIFEYISLFHSSMELWVFEHTVGSNSCEVLSQAEINYWILMWILIVGIMMEKENWPVRACESLSFDYHL